GGRLQAVGGTQPCQDGGNTLSVSERILACVQQPSVKQWLREDAGTLHIAQRSLACRINPGLSLLLQIGQRHDGRRL
ncbi:hypothetical protein, partial [Roseateles sp.]|uniref:hypothetical protein n=1 Tax=Roseateles sp. TaxID=1971397 RepID=UPI00391DFF32